MFYLSYIYIYIYMSTNKCFESINSTIVYGSDQTNTIRQKTIYMEMQRNSTTVGPNPIKKNGSRYNQNFMAAKLEHKLSLQYRLAAAKNYNLLLDITKGKRLANPLRTVGHNRFKMWGGNIMEVNYKKYNKVPVKAMNWTGGTMPPNIGSDNTITTLANCNPPCNWNSPPNYPGHIVDPNNNVFNSNCYLSTPAHIPPWIQNVANKNAVFKNTYYYVQGGNADPLRGITYPEKVYFKKQEACTESCFPSPSPPFPPAPTTMYKCDAQTKTCSEDASGTYPTVLSCQTACNPPPQQLYQCKTDTGKCVQNSQGTQTQEACAAACKQQMYSCDADLGTCSTSATGTSKEVCAATCKKNKYKCNPDTGGVRYQRLGHE